MVAAFTADYMEVINCLSVAGGGVKTKPIKLPEPESLRAAAPAARSLNRAQAPASRPGT